MKIIVLVKVVPDMERVRFDSERGVIDRTSAENEINPFDLNALEAAVQIKEKMGGEVIALSMGPLNAKEKLKDAVARGADKAILLSDRRFAGADTKATSLTLSKAIQKIGQYDLLLCGLKSVDGDTAHVGAEVAEFLGIPHIYYVNNVVEIQENNMKVISETDYGSYLLECKLPLLISVTKDINEPRLPSIRDKVRANKSEITIWNFDDFGEELGQDEVGIKGSPTMIKKIEVPPPIRRKGKIWKDDFSEALDEIIKILQLEKVNR